MFDTFPPSAEKRQKRTRTIPPAEMYRITPFALTGFASSGQAGHRVDEFLFQKISAKVLTSLLGGVILPPQTKLGNTSGGYTVNKEEILERSRKENKNQDIYEKEVIIQGNRYACIAAGVLATLFFVIQIFTGGGMNYGLYAVVFSMPMAGFWVKYIKLHKKHELFVAVCYTILVLLLSAAYIYGLVAASRIL